MPVTPYTWNQFDFFTAGRLNTDMYRLFGQYYSPNGVGFHGQRPVYKAFLINPTAPPGVTLGTTFAKAGFAAPAQNTWGTIADTSGWLGWRGDNQSQGFYGLSGLANGGGANGSNGGIALMTGNIALSTNSAQQVVAGLGDTVLRSIGTGQQLNSGSGNVSGPWWLDLVDTNSAGKTVTNWGQANTGTAALTATNQDGSGWQSRLHAAWASMYPANGTQVAALPAPAPNWTSSSPVLTAAYMNGTAGIANVMNLLNMPPLLRAFGLGNGTVTANATQTTCVYGSATWDTYGKYNTSTHTYTVPLSGLYLVSNFFPFDLAVPNTAGTVQAGVTISGTTYWGPNLPFGSSGSGVAAAAKAQVFSLNAGDTITPVVKQTSGGGYSGSGTYQGVFCVLFLGMQGIPSPLPTVPDISYSWAAGTPASQMPALMNAHFANDLIFLTQRPYLLAYQAHAQSGIAMATDTPVVCDVLNGIVHADTGDNYSGWTSGASNKYTSQRYGWYLAVQETFMAAPSLTTSPENVAGFKVTPAGATASDYYQGANASGASCGAAAVGIYYLRPGDTIQPIVRSNNTSSTTTATITGVGINSHFELVWLGQ